MTKTEALTSHVISRVVMYAVKSTHAARDRSVDLANSHTRSAEFYADWLVCHGHDVELEIAEGNGLRWVQTLTVDGRRVVQNGVYAVARMDGEAR